MIYSTCIFIDRNSLNIVKLLDRIMPKCKKNSGLTNLFDCNLNNPTLIFWKELARLTSAVQSVREARDERNARLQEICAQQDSSLQYTEVC